LFSFARDFLVPEARLVLQLFDLFRRLGDLALVAVEVRGELDQLALNFVVLVSEFLLSGFKLSLLLREVALLSFVILLVFVHHPALFEKTSGR
jgi:hypothetical protein